MTVKEITITTTVCDGCNKPIDVNKEEYYELIGHVAPRMKKRISTLDFHSERCLAKYVRNKPFAHWIDDEDEEEE